MTWMHHCPLRSNDAFLLVFCCCSWYPCCLVVDVAVAAMTGLAVVLLVQNEACLGSWFLSDSLWVYLAVL